MNTVHVLFIVDSQRKSEYFEFIKRRKIVVYSPLLMINRLVAYKKMTVDIALIFADYEAAEAFAECSNLICHYLEQEQKDQLWTEQILVSISGTEVIGITPSQMWNYFLNGSTGGFIWENLPDGTTKVQHFGIRNTLREELWA